ncbi:hypothetical protein [Flavobacterium muglaense]|uniref:Uncharacterized protein n=1 Tax=Flavobacterium muglaense TaxID=2764716 RepID=A0A923SF15_9FLAO|nr:hypothetical protein [Flavobacterium muglaense]MBC5836781.1 hypothetical protein [Flavobacterium muglaense]MBC5843269.1 hypothetical protein [Flavobacterium muglaense]
MITITNDLLPINPAYNDSIIEFEIDEVGTYPSAYIVIDSTDDIFAIYGINNKYFFNFKSIVTSLINKNNFKDSIIPQLYSSSIYDDESLSLILPITIYISGAFISKTYKFKKNVEQLIGYNDKINSSNTINILLPTQNNVDYYLPYFEGYPIDFAIFGLTTGDTYYLKNTSTYNISAPATSSNDKVKRLFLSDGANNEFLTNLIGLSTTVNKCELWVNETFKSNLLIKRNESKCGVYLKWFNDAGSYSYWLFDEISESIKTDTISELSTGFNNLQHLTSTSQITGKKADNAKVLTTKFNEFERSYIQSILSSPFVEMYIYNEPFRQMNQYSFIGVAVNESNTVFNKKNNQYKMNVTITLPQINTQTL